MRTEQADASRSSGAFARALRRLGRLAIAIGLAAGLAGGAHAQSLESVLEPGPVSESHAKAEHDCDNCHARFDRAAQTGLCQQCHKDVAADLKSHAGYHGRQAQQQACRTCHTEHKGRDAHIAPVDRKVFDHRQTDFELHDKHLGVACDKCHLAGKRWREAPDTCVACHRGDDKHKGTLGPDCASCHSTRGWKVTHFDHSKTPFPLTGRHVDVRCAACHLDDRLKNTPTQCVACHRKDDAHKGQFGAKCESCHGTRDWKAPTFDHDRDTRYPLRARHREVRCTACHLGPLFETKMSTSCVSCHEKDDAHHGSLGRDCASCHSESGWKTANGFDHDKARFPLRGAHREVRCEACHKDQRFTETPTACVACHRNDDRHRGSLGESCGDCHDEQRWKLSLDGFNHDKTRFPLRRAHADPTIRCVDCHVSLADFRNTPTACASCHRRDDRHEGTLGTRCETCHDDRSWRVANFDHGRTNFALVGRHLLLQCGACHRSLRFKDTPRDCAGCHAKDDHHQGALGRDCASCHNVRAWTLWDFDHDRRTRYPLVGRHRAVRCEACHSAPAPEGRPIAAASQQCVACHRRDDAHDGRFGQRCEQCHVSDDWRRMRFGVRPPEPGASTELR